MILLPEFLRCSKEFMVADNEQSVKIAGHVPTRPGSIWKRRNEKGPEAARVAFRRLTSDPGWALLCFESV